MPNHWLLKTEPTTYSFTDLLRDKRTTWDGVSNPTALINLRTMRKGDAALVCHTGAEKAIVGVARLVSDPYADPKLDDPKRVVVDLEAVRRLKAPLPLAAVKADKRFADFALVRIPRLSVMPVSAAQWKALGIED
ncbi:MAG TPA: EVE domain-containing protein [Gemmatimonadales bacterium]|jgi:predicted RNA-binding protein with PUA-like domain|nr:EVE domain-containing protein [Gemmatimonadales bacterium]